MHTSARVAAHIFAVIRSYTAEGVTPRYRGIKLPYKEDTGQLAVRCSIWCHGYFIGADIYTRKDTCMSTVMYREEAKGLYDVACITSDNT
jgi:hypothetical protein